MKNKKMVVKIIAILTIMSLMGVGIFYYIGGFSYLKYKDYAVYETYAVDELKSEDIVSPSVSNFKIYTGDEVESSIYTPVIVDGVDCMHFTFMDNEIDPIDVPKDHPMIILKYRTNISDVTEEDNSLSGIIKTSAHMNLTLMQVSTSLRYNKNGEQFEIPEGDRYYNWCNGNSYVDKETVYVLTVPDYYVIDDNHKEVMWKKNYSHDTFKRAAKNLLK